MANRGRFEKPEEGFSQKKWELGAGAALLLLLPLSLGILFLTLLIQVGDVFQTLQHFVLHPVLLPLNLTPVLVLLVLFWALAQNPFTAAAITTLLCSLLSLANRIKIEARYDPLVPSDFALLGEAMTATGEYRLDLHIPILIGVLLLVGILLFFAWKCRFQKPKLLTRILAAVLAVALMTAGILTLYPDKTLYSRLCSKTPDVSEYNVPTVFDGLGFPYCFMHNFNLYPVERPKGYSAKEAAAWAEGGEDLGIRPDVNVLFVQCEAFSDIMYDSVFTWEGTENPLYEYTLVATSSQSISGHVIVSNYGAGTANTEFDIFTGMPTLLIAEGNTSSFRVVHHKISSLARILSDYGYENFLMHPGKHWFYNRENVYDYFGISDQIFEDQFEGSKRKGKYVSDEAFGERLCQILHDHLEQSDAPLGAFTISIQNHQAYPYTKYEEQLAPAKLNKTVSDDTMETITVYAEGIRDSAIMLHTITDYVDTLDAPTVIVFWGDHLPALGKHFSVYQELGFDIGYETTLQGTLNTYCTPFTIWGNQAFCERQDMTELRNALDLPDNPTISSIYLGELAYEILGLRGADPYFDYLAELRRELPVLRPGCYMLADGTLTAELTPAQQEMVDKLHKWEYYRILDERIKE